MLRVLMLVPPVMILAISLRNSPNSKERLSRMLKAGAFGVTLGLGVAAVAVLLSVTYR